MPSSTSQKRSSVSSISTITSTSSISSSLSRPNDGLQRYPSSSSSRSSNSSSSSSPALRQSHHKVQLIPHAPTPTYHATPLTPTEAALVRESETKISEFDDLDLSTADFDFDDVFTFDRPAHSQRRLRQGIVEVSVGGSRANHHHHHHHHHHQQLQQQRAAAHVGRRDWGEFNFSHFVNHHAGRQQQQVRLKPGMAGMQRELGLDFSRQVMQQGGAGSGIGAKYLRNREAVLGFQRRR